MLESILSLLLTGLLIQSQPANSASLANANRILENKLPEAQPKVIDRPIRAIDSESLGMEVSAENFLVIDEKSGEVLYARSQDEKKSIASITKLMTALVFLENNPGWNKEITVSSTDYRPGGVSYLISGEKFTVKDIFNAMLVASSNEAAAALARSTGLSEDQFVAKMNQKAKQLNMFNSSFYDVTGLHKGNAASARDVATLAKIAFTKAEITSAVNNDTYDLRIINAEKNRTIKSTDKILGKPFGTDSDTYRVEAGKTGYIEAAGYCFASRLANKANNKIIIVVLGSSTIDSRFRDTKALAYWVYNNYKWQ